MHMAFNFSERHTRTATIVLVALVGIAACGSDPDSVSTPPPPDASPTSTPAGNPASTSANTPAAATAPATAPADDIGTLGPPMQRLVDVAAADLVGRFDLSASSPENPIVVATAEEITWRDSALGCPRKDMQYMQVLTPGFRIVLEFEGATYAYHSGAGQDPFYCARPEKPAPSATPLD